MSTTYVHNLVSLQSPRGTRSSIYRHTVPTRITKCTKFDQLILRKIIKIVATRCQISRLKCTKFDFGWGSAVDPAGGAYSVLPDPLLDLRGATSKGREGMGRKGDRERKEGIRKKERGGRDKGKGRGGEGGTGMGGKV